MLLNSSFQTWSLHVKHKFIFISGHLSSTSFCHNSKNSQTVSDLLNDNARSESTIYFLTCSIMNFPVNRQNIQYPYLEQRHHLYSHTGAFHWCFGIRTWITRFITPLSCRGLIHFFDYGKFCFFLKVSLTQTPQSATTVTSMNTTNSTGKLIFLIYIFPCTMKGMGPLIFFLFDTNIKSEKLQNIWSYFIYFFATLSVR